MKGKIIGDLSRGITITAFATLGLVSIAHADWTDNYSASGISTPGNFTHFGPGGQAPEFDQSQYDKVNLGPLSASIWAPKRGAQGPMRDDEASKMAAMQARDIENRLGPIGGRNTP